MNRKYDDYSNGVFKGVKSIIFDVDQTLINYTDSKRSAVNAAIDAMMYNGLGISKEDAVGRIYDIYHKKGVEYQYAFDELLGQFSFDENKLKDKSIKNRLLASAISAYREKRDKVIRPYTNVEFTLKDLKDRGYTIAALSDCSEKEIWRRLYQSGLDGYFSIVVAYDGDGIKKPDHRAFGKVLDTLVLNPEETLMVGDNPKSDINGAKKIGMKTALAKYGFQDKYFIDKLHPSEKLIFFPHTLDESDPYQKADAEISEIKELLYMLPQHPYVRGEEK